MFAKRPTTLPAESHEASLLADASDGLETVARRSEGLLHFVQNHRRLTKQAGDADLRSSRFSRHLRAYFTALRRRDLTARDITLRRSVEPETLEVEADGELLDQALINLMRNAIEALRQ